MTFDEWFEQFKPEFENMTFREFVRYYSEQAWLAAQKEMMNIKIQEINNG